MATVRFALVGVFYISEEHARLSGPPHHRDTLGEGTNFSFLRIRHYIVYSECNWLRRLENTLERTKALRVASPTWIIRFQNVKYNKFSLHCYLVMHSC